jgi:hypothetical protein
VGRNCLSLCLLLFVAAPHFQAAAQSPTEQPAAVPAGETARRPLLKPDQTPFPCFAKETHPPKTFSGFWNPRPVNKSEAKRVTVLIGFDHPDSKFPFDCVGEPLQVTVPNGQIVNLAQENWMAGCTPTLTINPAVSDSSVSDLLTLIAKVGAFGYDGGTLTYHELPPLKNKILNISVICNIPAAGGVPARKLTQTATITYQNPPRVTVSAGLLVSTEGVKSYTILTTKTGVNSSGVSTSQTSIGVSGDSSAQVIPFGFVNLYLAGSRKLNLSSQFGIGVNPNLSTVKVEFFAAPLVLAWHDFYFAPGIHFGQHEKLTGGFSVGDVVTGMSKPPIGWHYQTGFAFSLSYNLKPLIKSSAPPAAKGN